MATDREEDALDTGHRGTFRIELEVVSIVLYSTFCILGAEVECSTYIHTAVHLS